MKIELHRAIDTTVDHTLETAESIRGVAPTMIVPDNGEYTRQANSIVFRSQSGATLLAVERLRQSASLVWGQQDRLSVVVGFPHLGPTFTAVGPIAGHTNFLFLSKQPQFARVPQDSDYLGLVIHEPVLLSLCETFGRLWNDPQKLMTPFAWSEKRTVEKVTRETWEHFAEDLEQTNTEFPLSRRGECPLQFYNLLKGAIIDDINAKIEPTETFSRDPAVAVIAQCQSLLSSLWFRPVTVRELSEMSGYSQQKIHQCFSKVIGMSPRDWHQAQRLGLVRSTLKHASPYRQTVAEVAKGHGFHHLGRFSEMYRRVFREYPSTTLRKY